LEKQRAEILQEIYGCNKTDLLYCIINPSSNLRDETGSSDFKNLDGARLEIWRVGVEEEVILD
jgi:hypothetical protein